MFLKPVSTYRAEANMGGAEVHMIVRKNCVSSAYDSCLGEIYDCDESKLTQSYFKKNNLYYLYFFKAPENLSNLKYYLLRILVFLQLKTSAMCADKNTNTEVSHLNNQNVSTLAENTT